MYLSRLILNPRSRRVQREIADSYQLHRSILNAFPDDLSADKERVLFRLDQDARSGDLTLLVQSWTLPDWSWLAEPNACDYLRPVSVPNPALKEFKLDLAAGQALSFRLRANPTVKREGSRHGLYKEEEQRAWLARKGERNGFQPLRVTVIREGDQLSWKPRKDKEKRKLTHFAVRFDGLLRVTDPDALWEAVRTGIGPAKSFGFGLLSLGPPSMR